jgi:hypothetical protein
MSGTYTVRLIAGGKTISQSFKIVMDPRVKTSAADLQAQFDAAKSIYDDLMRATTAIHEITVLRDQLKARSGQAPVATGASALEPKLDAIVGSDRGGRGGGGRGGPAGPANLGSVRVTLARIEKQIENADAAPTAAQIEAWHLSAQPLDGLLNQWQQLKQTDLKALNNQLKVNHLALLKLDTQMIDHDVEDQIELGDEN